jgi:hypothetical protein
MAHAPCTACGVRIAPGVWSCPSCGEPFSRSEHTSVTESTLPSVQVEAVAPPAALRRAEEAFGAEPTAPQLGARPSESDFGPEVTASHSGAHPAEAHLALEATALAPPPGGLPMPGATDPELIAFLEEGPPPFQPLAPTLLLGIGAAIWFLRAGGVLGAATDPHWLFALVAADLLVAMLLMIGAGPARGLAVLAFLAQLAAAAALGEAPWGTPLDWAYAAHAGFGLLSAVGEPSPLRRTLGLGLASAAATLAVISLGLEPRPARPLPPAELSSAQWGYSLRLPVGYELSAGGAGLAVPQQAQGSVVSFHSRRRGAFGVLVVERGLSTELRDRCEHYHRELGGADAPRVLPAQAPSSLAGGLVFELRTRAGAAGRLACGFRGGKLAAMAVVVAHPNPEVGAAEFDRVGAALRVE